MFTRMKKFTLQSIKLILNIIYVPFFIANRVCVGIISYLGVEYKDKDSQYYITKNTGILGFIDEWMNFVYDLWDGRTHRNPERERLTMYKVIKEILINLAPRLLSLPFIAALAITKGVLMLASSVLHATNYVLEHVVIGINKLITTIDSHIASYDEDDFSQPSHQDDKDNTLASKTLGLSIFDWPISAIYSQSNLKTNNNQSALNEPVYNHKRSSVDSDGSTNSRNSLSMEN